MYTLVSLVLLSSPSEMTLLFSFLSFSLSYILSFLVTFLSRSLFFNPCHHSPDTIYVGERQVMPAPIQHNPGVH